MTIHRVAKGESLWSIAREYGFLNWRALYDHPDNAAFRKLRPNPAYIVPGDLLVIPGHENKFKPKTPQAPAEPEDVFEQYLQHLTRLEHAAVAEGHTSLERRITDFRLIYYPNGAPVREFFGAVVGGGTWNILIPGAASAREPETWRSNAELAASRTFLLTHKVLEIRGHKVDLGHLFAGLDAANHPATISLGGLIILRSNMAAATYAGDLGSVVGEYVSTSTESVYELARRPDHERLNRE
jgi:hypothetical protein